MKIILAIPLFVIFVCILYLRAKVREFAVIYDELLKCLNSINDRVNKEDREVIKHINSVNDRIKAIEARESTNSNSIAELYNKIQALEITEYYIPKDD